MIKLQIIPMISSGENGSIEQRAKTKFNRSAKCFSSKVSRLQPPAPSRSTILRNVQYLNTGTSLNLNKGNLFAMNGEVNMQNVRQYAP